MTRGPNGIGGFEGARARPLHPSVLASAGAGARPSAGFGVVVAMCLPSIAGSIGCAPRPAALTCNGSEALCDKRFDEVTLAGAHNAMSSIHDDFAAPNQREGIADQLAMGIRAFLIDTYVTDEGSFLCHTSCEIGKIPLADTLAIFKHHLDEHPGDVVALMVQDEAPLSAFVDAMTESGLVDDVIVHDTRSPWPTMRELGGKVFVTAEHTSAPPSWNNAMYLNYVDTPFSFHTIDALAAPESCARNRGGDENPLMLVNHWVEDPLPDEAVAGDVNAHDVLLERAQRCSAVRRHRANVIAVDYAGTGDLIDVVNELNQVDANNTAE